VSHISSEGVAGFPAMAPANFSMVKQAVECETPEIAFVGVLQRVAVRVAVCCSVAEVCGAVECMTPEIAFVGVL